MQHKDTPSSENEQEQPNRESNMEQAEGSRDTVNSNLAGNQGGHGTSTMSNQDSELPEDAVGQHEQGGGISNRPLDEEQERQEQLPPRGERRENWKED